MDADGASDDLRPPVAGLRAEDPTLRAVVLSHGHGDHWGLLPLCRPNVPLAMGAATARIMCAAAPFVPNAFVPNVSFELNDRRTFQIGRFSITPRVTSNSSGCGQSNSSTREAGQGTVSLSLFPGQELQRLL
ncbi:MBL fold metallo-hydrolase [Bradyrhizobium japonicum]|uniref:MBL fold metallo-hydrolase n=1 Tax=Bradyrhizobium japonicum TaxID=375 RepID=UPI00209F86B1|nr:MBL fold metallo-hydrolase [Bradyrhizobium japonicum]